MSQDISLQDSQTVGIFRAFENMRDMRYMRDVMRRNMFLYFI